MIDAAEKALAPWGFQDAVCTLAAARENHVYQVQLDGRSFALRLHRPGYRTDAEAYTFISEHHDVPIVVLELQDPDFYHLDTCFCPLDEHTVLIYGPAFTAEGRRLIHHFFDRVLEAPEYEARHLFACNAHCPDGKHVIIQTGCTQTNHLLQSNGYIPVEVDTSEFLKAGGSVFCMNTGQ